MSSRIAPIIIVLLVVFVNLCGIAGYMMIEGWGFFDSLYMTVITLTTTGYQEVHRLSEAGRMFTVCLLVVGMGTVGYSITIVMSQLLSINFTVRGRRKRMENIIAKQKNHTVICGYGRMGRVICQELAKAGEDFVVIERDKSKILELESTKYLWLEGDATSDELLIKAGIEFARVFVSMVDDDADGLYLALAGRSLNPNVHIIVRASDESARNKILRAGANKVILPILTSGQKVAQSVLNPAFEDLLDITGKTNEKVQLIDITVKESSKLAGKSLNQCNFSENSIIVVGIRDSNGSFQFAPSNEHILEVGECLITLSTADSYKAVAKSFNL